jgi:hypothetical protein
MNLLSLKTHTLGSAHRREEKNRFVGFGRVRLVFGSEPAAVTERETDFEETREDVVIDNS